MTNRESPPSAGLRGLAAGGQQMLGDVRVGAGAWARDDLSLDPGWGRARRFTHAALLPSMLLRRVWRDPSIRRPYLRATLPVVVLTLGVGVVSGVSAFWDRSHPDAHHLKAVHFDGRSVSMDFGDSPPAASDAKESELADRDQASDEDDDYDDDDEEEAKPKVVKGVPTPPAPRRRAAPHKKATLEIPDDDDRKHSAAWWTAIYGAMVIAEWCLLALTREHQDQLARRVALATEAPPDDPESQAHLRVDIPWLFRKLKRKAIGTFIFGVCLFPATIVSWWFGARVSAAVDAALGAFWGIYWSGVFALGKSRLAWAHGLTGEPWFLRLETLLGRRAWIVKWWAPRTYLRFLGRAIRSVKPATLAFELAYAEAYGLGLARLVCGLPGIYTLTRPVFAVAAAHVLVPHLRAAPTPAGEVTAGASR